MQNICFYKTELGHGQFTEYFCCGLVVPLVEKHTPYGTWMLTQNGILVHLTHLDSSVPQPN
jgi:hypothetical protein